MGQSWKTVEASVGKAVVVGANPPPPPQPTFLGAVLLTIALIVAIIVAWWNWQEAHEEEAKDSPEDLLASFEEAHAAGEIDDDEMNRLRAQLTENPRPRSSESSAERGE